MKRRIIFLGCAATLVALWALIPTIGGGPVNSHPEWARSQWKRSQARLAERVGRMWFECEDVGVRVRDGVHNVGTAIKAACAWKCDSPPASGIDQEKSPLTSLAEND